MKNKKQKQIDKILNDKDYIVSKKYNNSLKELSSNNVEDKITTKAIEKMLMLKEMNLKTEELFAKIIEKIKQKINL